MIQIHRGYQVLALTAERFERMRSAIRAGTGRRSVQIRCQPFLFPADDASDGGLGDFGPPPLGVFLLDAAGPLDHGPLAFTVFRHHGLERFFQRRRGLPEDVVIKARPLRQAGFRLRISPNSGIGESEFASFLFETDAGLDRSWVSPVQDGAFLARSVEAIALTTMELLWERSHRRWPRVPHLDRQSTFGFELMPGMWIALPSSWLAMSHRGNVVPALVFDPERYAWREGVDPSRSLEPQNTYLAADLSAYGDRARWDRRLMQVGEDPDALPTIRQVVADLCVERATGKAPATIECRPFVWARLVDF